MCYGNIINSVSGLHTNEDRGLMMLEGINDLWCWKVLLFMLVIADLRKVILVEVCFT